MKSFITKLLSTTLVLLISLSLINISILSSEEEDEPTLDPGVYTFTIPATLHIKGDGSDKLTMFAEWGKGIEGINLSTSSKNVFNLIAEDGTSIKYEFVLGDYSSSTYSTYLENIIVLLDEYKYAGNYTDTLTFEIEPFYLTYNITHVLGDNVFFKDDYSPVVNYTINDTVTLPTSSNVSKEGFTFAGWYLNDSYDGDPITTFSGLDHIGGITLYAKWDVIVTNELPIAEEETPIEEVVEETKEEDETTEQEMVEEEKKEEESIPEVVEEIVNEEEANN